MTISKKPALPANKPQRLYFKTYLQAIHNSVGSNLFRNFYISTPEDGEFDALGDGSDSCAFFVSALLVIFHKLGGVHGTVDATIQDLRDSGWTEVETPQTGDVIIWEALQFEDGLKEHIGFSVGNHRAISTSWTQKTPIDHDERFGETNRKIIRVYRMNNWDN